MWEWLKSLGFPTGAEAWKVFIPAVFSAAAIVVSVSIATTGWRNAERTQQRQAERKLIIDAATACSDAFDKLYDATQSLGRQAIMLAAPRKLSFEEAGKLLEEPRRLMDQAYLLYRRSLVRLSYLTDLGDLKPANPAPPNDGLQENFQQISWAANSLFSDDESERRAAMTSLAQSLRDDYDKQGFLGTYRIKLEQALNATMLQGEPRKRS